MGDIFFPRQTVGAREVSRRMGEALEAEKPNVQAVVAAIARNGVSESELDMARNRYMLVAAMVMVNPMLAPKERTAFAIVEGLAQKRARQGNAVSYLADVADNTLTLSRGIVDLMTLNW